MLESDAAIVAFEAVDAEGREVEVPKETSVALDNLRRLFKRGDHVCVKRGLEIGRYGMVTNVDGPVLTFSDYRMTTSETSVATGGTSTFTSSDVRHTSCFKNRETLICPLGYRLHLRR